MICITMIWLSPERQWELWLLVGMSLHWEIIHKPLQDSHIQIHRDSNEYFTPCICSCLLSRSRPVNNACFFRQKCGVFVWKKPSCIPVRASNIFHCSAYVWGLFPQQIYIFEFQIRTKNLIHWKRCFFLLEHDSVQQFCSEWRSKGKTSASAFGLVVPTPGLPATCGKVQGSYQQRS